MWEWLLFGLAAVWILVLVGVGTLAYRFYWQEGHGLVEKTISVRGRPLIRGPNLSTSHQRRRLERKLVL